MTLKFKRNTQGNKRHENWGGAGLDVGRNGKAHSDRAPGHGGEDGGRTVHLEGVHPGGTVAKGHSARAVCEGGTSGLSNPLLARLTPLS